MNERDFIHEQHRQCVEGTLTTFLSGERRGQFDTYSTATSNREARHHDDEPETMSVNNWCSTLNAGRRTAKRAITPVKNRGWCRSCAPYSTMKPREDGRCIDTECLLMEKRAPHRKRGNGKFRRLPICAFSPTMSARVLQGTCTSDVAFLSLPQFARPV